MKTIYAITVTSGPHPLYEELVVGAGLPARDTKISQEAYENEQDAIDFIAGRAEHVSESGWHGYTDATEQNPVWYDYKITPLEVK